MWYANGYGNGLGGGVSVMGSLLLGIFYGGVYSIFTVPAGALIGYMRAKVAEGKAVEYVIGDGEWVIVK